MSKVLPAIILAAATVLSGCEKVDNHRIPPANVAITFNTIGDWHQFGVSGAGEIREFIKQEGIPAGYPYKSLEYTGFGGVMLVCDPNGEYLAYDLACPVEANQSVRVQPDTSNPLAGMARCPKCKSVYNLFGMGAPVEGEALKLKYGLENYFVSVGSTMPPYAVIRR